MTTMIGLLLYSSRNLGDGNKRSQMILMNSIAVRMRMKVCLLIGQIVVDVIVVVGVDDTAGDKSSVTMDTSTDVTSSAVTGDTPSSTQELTPERCG